MNQTKRIVIIEGDAFDADAIVAIVRVGMGTLCVAVHTEHKTFESYHADEAARDAAMAVAVDAWRKAVGDVSVPHPEPLPFPPVIEPVQPKPEPTYWSDEKGRFYETYDGQPIYLNIIGERLIWNAGPPGRANVLGPGASPIVKIYVDEAGKPLDPQPI